jgi:predicted O-linked N-acetylglucosamine transferase (SPINDLY family)
MLASASPFVVSPVAVSPLARPPLATPKAARARARRDWERGLAHLQACNWTLAAQAFGRATRAAPQDGLYWINLSNALRRAGELVPALDAARHALKLDATNPEALRLVGDCCLGLHRYADGALALRALEAAGHTETDAMLQHASLLHTLCRYDEAIAVLLRALAKDPALVRGHALLGDICRDRGMKREAVECIKTVLALEPGNLEALSRLSLEKRHLCDWTDFDADLQTLQNILEALPAGRALMAATFSLLSLPLPPALHLKAAQADALAICGGVQPLPAVLPAQRPGPRIRLGLVSFDFRDHPVAQLLLPVLEQLDRQRFELLLYSNGPNDHSSLRARAVRVADQFVELNGLSDAQAADRIREDGVDLLIDLMGHTRGARAGIFARKPAPVQAAFLGFPGSTGMAAIDYVVGDPLVTPLELAANYSEKLALMPLTLQPNGADRPLPQPMTRAHAGLPEDAFVMCAFNHTYKIGPEAFDTWCGLLRDLPNAVLWLKETNPQFHAQVLQAAAERGVAAERIVFAPIVRYADHFSRLALADVFVDTWPYNAHTTASDALWAGVPVVTHYGDSYASRVAASVLNAVGLAELAFASVADYRCAIQVLALEPALLAGYRQHLVTQRQTLPLFDAPRYTRELEALFVRMVQRWRAGLPADHLTDAQQGEPA